MVEEPDPGRQLLVVLCNTLGKGGDWGKNGGVRKGEEMGKERLLADS